MKLARRMVAGAVALAVGLGALAISEFSVAQNAKDGVVLPDGIYDKLVEQSAKAIKDSVGSAKPSKADKARAHTAAIMLAVYGQYSASKNKNAVAQAGMEIATAVGKGKLDEAVKKAGGLAALKGEGKAIKVQLEKDLDMEELMYQFSDHKSGGLGIEQHLQNLGEKKSALTEKDMDDRLVLWAHQAAIIGEFIKDHTPSKGDKKLWKKFAEEMTATSLDLAKVAAAKKDGKAALVAVRKVNDSCVKCHDKFK